MPTLNELEGLTKRALVEGALAAEVLFTHADTASISGLSKPTVVRRGVSELTVRVWVQGGRVGVQRGAPSDAGELVAQALACTFESPEDPFAGPVEWLAGDATGLGIRDRRADQLTDADRTSNMSDLRKQVRSRRFEYTALDYDEVNLERRLVNSRGAMIEERSTRYRVDATIEGVGLTLSQSAASRSFSSVASLPIGTILIQRADALLKDGGTLPEGPVRVVLPPLPMSRLLAALGPCFSASSLSGAGVFLQSAGGPSLSSKLHLVDHGSAPGGLHTRLFDDRGVPPVPLTLLREGVVAGRFLSPEKARQLDTIPTGHSWGEALLPNNLVMREGTRSINALLTEHGGPSLMIDDLPDLSGLDLKTGAFEATVNGIVMEANAPVGAMRGVRVRGNVVDLLSQIVEICNDTDRIGHVDAAAIIADGLELLVP